MRFDARSPYVFIDGVTVSLSGAARAVSVRWWAADVLAGERQMTVPWPTLLNPVCAVQPSPRHVALSPVRWVRTKPLFFLTSCWQGFCKTQGVAHALSRAGY